MLELLGVSADWVKRERIGLIDLEHHIWFQRELHVGEEVTMHLRFTACNDKRAQGVVFLRNTGDGEVAGAIEFLSLAVHLDTRRAVPLPPVVRERLDTLLREHEALAWPAPRCGSISV
jgi:acyl-CoA thioesterase FadM